MRRCLERMVPFCFKCFCLERLSNREDTGARERAQFIWLFSLIPVGLCQGTLPWSGSHSTSASSSVDAAIPARLGQVWVTLVMTLVPATVSSGVRSLYADLSYSELRHSLAYGPSQHLISLIGTLENIRTSPTWNAS